MIFEAATQDDITKPRRRQTVAAFRLSPSRDVMKIAHRFIGEENGQKLVSPAGTEG